MTKRIPRIVGELETKGSAIVHRMRPMFWAPTARRHYTKLDAAIRSEAIAKIAQRYPYGAPEVVDGLGELPGESWRDQPNSAKRLRRMIAYIRAHMVVHDQRLEVSK